MLEKNILINYKRLKRVAILYGVVMLVLVIRLYFLQMHPSKVVEGEIANHQTEQIKDTNYKILDSSGKEMNEFKKEYIVVIDSKPFKLNNYEETLTDLMALNFILKTEKSNFNYTDIMNSEGKLYYTVSKETYDKVNKLKNIKGVYSYEYDKIQQREAWRIENVLLGINEKNSKEDSLQKDLYQYLKNNIYPLNRFFLDDKAVYNKNILDEGENNNNIKLTIDSSWDAKTREILKSEKYAFLKNIGVVISEADTGEIKVLAQKDESQANVNLGAQQLGYEAGSVFKLVTESVGLDLGIIHTGDKYVCSGAICSKDGKSYPHGEMTVEEALEISCNDIFAKVGSEIGYDKMMGYCDKMGLYKPVLNLKGNNKNEASGKRPNKEDGMNNISIGQSMAVTPIQMAGVINTIVNNGIYIKPRVIDSIVNNEGEEVKKFEGEPLKVFSDTTSKIMQQEMQAVIWKGSGHEARLDGCEIGGKTGTATVSKGVNHGWFAGYFVYNNKKYSIVVVSPSIGDKHPDGRELGGGNTGAPIFKEIIESIINNS